MDPEPRDDDAVRAAAALLRAVLREDEEGIAALCADPSAELLRTLAGIAVGALQIVGGQLGHVDADQLLESRIAGFLQQIPTA